jgi:hypothetical protein
MAVPARPVAGALLDAAWGQVAHDAAVAVDIQSGSANITVTASTQGSTVVTFPRPFASTPNVVATLGPSSSGAALSYFPQLAAVSPTSVTLRLSGGGSTTFGPVAVQWVAIGTRA